MIGLSVLPSLQHLTLQILSRGSLLERGSARIIMAAFARVAGAIYAFLGPHTPPDSGAPCARHVCAGAFMVFCHADASRAWPFFPQSSSMRPAASCMRWLLLLLFGRPREAMVSFTGQCFLLFCFRATVSRFVRFVS